MKSDLQKLCLELACIVIYRSVSEDGATKKLSELLLSARDGGSELDRTRKYGDFLFELYRRGGDLGLYLRDMLTCDDNPYVRMYASGKPIPDSMKECFMREAGIFSELSGLTCETLLSFCKLDPTLPRYETTPCDFTKLLPKVAENCARLGYGMFARYGMFSVSSDGKPKPVLSPDPVRLSSLVGYTDERKSVLDNTIALLEGKPAANVLLCGDAGTGKSSTVKAIANEFYPRGLRLIEVQKDKLKFLPDIMGELADNPLKFIIFTDDLSFASDDDNFGALKAVLEGSAAAKTPNTVIYATSNRRHMVKETFSQRGGDDVHVRDTMEELMSLSERFGLTVLFSRPPKNLYLQIVRTLAEEKKIDMPITELELKAEAFALAKGGRSARTAGQFVDGLLTQNNN